LDDPRSKEELEALREELPNSKWQAQYQQNPVGNESAIVKRDWWKWCSPLCNTSKIINS
jgi:hypothetical protein